MIKKYPSLKNELSELTTILMNNSSLGTSLGKNAFKIRVAIKSKGSGKSGGARVITYIVTETDEIYLLTIYDKSELDSISSDTIKKIIKAINPNH